MKSKHYNLKIENADWMTDGMCEDYIFAYQKYKLNQKFIDGSSLEEMVREVSG